MRYTYIKHCHSPLVYNIQGGGGVQGSEVRCGAEESTDQGEANNWEAQDGSEKLGGTTEGARGQREPVEVVPRV